MGADLIQPNTWRPNILPDPMIGNSDTNGVATFPNGIKMLWGKTAIIAADGFVDIVHGFAECFQAIICQADSPDGLMSYAPEVTTVDNTKFRITNIDGSLKVQCRYFAIGR